MMDVASKIVSFIQNGPRVVSILSGTGVISNVTLIRDSPSGETVTFEVIVGSYVADGEKEPKSANHFEASPAPLNANLRGRFRIFSLSGSFVLCLKMAVQALGGLSVSVTGSDGQRVHGGVVAGTLTAASSVRWSEDPKSSDDSEASSSTLSNSSLSGMMGANIPPSRGTSGGSSG
ncbi:AT hook motif domain containing protein, expressed [Datura stramonium]|uniref:AT-hook motif nuclear-localized protein n=1 Tax=Datura stramonium TaxID=4076 RepID=A0ABS8RMK2_DATST|nr:AT hook motif domain containing protein, expressed [Datura stramonium]